MRKLTTTLTTSTVALLLLFTPQTHAAPHTPPVQPQDMLCGLFNKLWDNEKAQKIKAALAYKNEDTSPQNVARNVQIAEQNCKNTHAPSFVDWMDPNTVLTPQTTAQLLTKPQHH